MNPALRVSLEALEACELGWPRSLQKLDLERAQRGLPRSLRPRVTELVSSCLRQRRSLRLIVGHCLRRSLKKAKPRLAATLQLATLLQLRQDPDAIKLRKAAPSRKIKERLDRLEAILEAQILERRPEQAGDSDALLEGCALLLPRRGVVAFKEDLLGNHGRSLARRLGAAHSLPDELCEAWLASYGDDADRICRAANLPPPLFARRQRLRVSLDDLRAQLLADGVESSPIGASAPDALRLDANRAAFRKSAAFTEGLFSIQDLTAQEVPRALAPRAGDAVLDLCAAPGGKATYLAELSDDAAKLLAIDRKAERLRRVEQAAERLDLHCIETKNADGRDRKSIFGMTFDRALVDAPCSNTGVLRRRPEARWRFQRKGQRRMTSDQLALAQNAAERLGPKGFMVYSTCSIEVEEGPQLVARLLAGSRLELLSETQRLPQAEGGDGGYHALLRRRPVQSSGAKLGP